MKKIYFNSNNINKWFKNINNSYICYNTGIKKNNEYLVFMYDQTFNVRMHLAYYEHMYGVWEEIVKPKINKKIIITIFEGYNG